MDLQNGRLQLAPSKLMEKFCWISFAWFTFHVAYVTLRLPYLLLTGVEIPLLSLLWHSTILVVTPITVFWHNTAYFQWPGITATCVNNIFEM